MWTKITAVDIAKARRPWPPSGFPDKDFSFSVPALMQDVLVKTWNNDPDITLELQWPSQEIPAVLQLCKRGHFPSGSFIPSLSTSPAQSAWIHIFLLSHTLEWNADEWGLGSEYSKKRSWLSWLSSQHGCEWSLGQVGTAGNDPVLLQEQLERELNQLQGSASLLFLGHLQCPDRTG